MEDNNKPVKVKKEKVTPAIEPKFSKQKHDQINKFVSMVNLQQKHLMDEVFLLYNEYVGPKMYTYSTNCNCATSIVNLYWALVNWFKVNKEKFATE